MKTTVPCFSVAGAPAVRLLIGAVLAAPLTIIAPTDGASRMTTAQEWSTEVDGKTVTLRAPAETEAGDVVVLRDGVVSYRHQSRGRMGGVVGWRDLTGDGTPEIQFSVLTSRSTSQSIVLEATPRKIHELVSLSGRFGSGLSLDSLSPSSGLRVAAYDLPGLTQTDIKALETDDGYASCVVPDGEYSGTALVLRDGAVVYRQPLMGPLPMAFQGQPEDEAHCYPIKDLTGNGHGNVHIQDMTSRSTTVHVILDLGPDGVSEIVNATLHFTENLVWDDTDGDGVLEPIVSGKEGLDQIRPGRPGIMPLQELDAPVTRGLTIE